jgi:hypothetical protein
MVVGYTHAIVCEIRLVSSGIIEESAVSLATITVIFGIVESAVTQTIPAVPKGVGFAAALGRTFISKCQITITVDFARFDGLGKTKTGLAPALSRRQVKTGAIRNSRAVDIARIVVKGKTAYAQAFSRRLANTEAVWNSRAVDSARIDGKGKGKTGLAYAFSRRQVNTEAVWNSRAVEIARIVVKGKTG